jgi:hypothetical protein
MDNLSLAARVVCIERGTRAPLPEGADEPDDEDAVCQTKEGPGASTSLETTVLTMLAVRQVAPPN